MSEIKLRQLAQMDPEFAEMLKELFQSEGISETDYLDMTLADFLKFVTISVEKVAKVLEEALKKREHKA
jgi:hypothetical protein